MKSIELFDASQFFQSAKSSEGLEERKRANLELARRENIEMYTIVRPGLSY